MNAFFLVIPIFLIRYGLLRLISKEAFDRAGFFPTVIGGEQVALSVYLTTNILMFLDLFFRKVDADSAWFSVGLIIYGLGIVLYLVSILNYAQPTASGLNFNGLYQVSRNPMYIAYFIYFLGCVLLTQSWTLLAILIVFQTSVHWLILSEERWCMDQFGEEYKQYMNKVGRYFI